jgi:quinol monooxygenase YgiN
MTVTLGLLALLEAQPGKGDELAQFLEAGRALAVAEQGTVTWYAFKLGETTFGIFDTFESENERQAHLDGEIPQALAAVSPGLLAAPPDIRLVELIAVK